MTIFKRKLKGHFHVFLALLLLFLVFFSFPPDELQAIETATQISDPNTSIIDPASEVSVSDSSPLVLIESPVDGAEINSSEVVISGVVSDDLTPLGKIQLSLYENAEAPITINTDSNGIWVTSMKLAAGKHTIYVKASDESGNSTTDTVAFLVKKVTASESAVTTLTVEMEHVKVVKEVTLSNKENRTSNLMISPDSTRVKLDTNIKMKVSDTVDSQNYTGKTSGNPITLFKKIENENRLEMVDGTTNYDPINMQFVFTPTPLLSGKPALSPNTTYYVYINRALMDSGIKTEEESGFYFYPRFLKFTTTSNADEINPHGNYKVNSNICKSCHNTHSSKGTNLEEPNFYEMQDIDLKANNYCMACHDGTIAPLPENQNDTHKHSTSIDQTLLPSAGACTACHDPHLTWSEDNPSLFKNHYVYQHSQKDKGVIAVEPIDSEKEACETCHDDASSMKVNVRESSFKVFHYRKAPAATGKSEDFGLCLRCHNGEMKGQNNVAISNIQQFYQDDKTEASNLSKHWVTQNDGSALNGHIPCAECHDTHGSNNIKLLKDMLGHGNQRSFSAASGEWDAVKERDFCLKCHNGFTAIYGVTGSLPSPGHENRTEACSSCHGGESQSFLEAAHAPKTSTKPLQ